MPPSRELSHVFNLNVGGIKKKKKSFDLCVKDMKCNLRSVHLSTSYAFISLSLCVSSRGHFCEKAAYSAC